MAKDQRPDFVVISWETAEYLSVLIGQVSWGNQKRRGSAAEEMGNAMQGHPMETSLDCFADQSKKKK